VVNYIREAQINPPACRARRSMTGPCTSWRRHAGGGLHRQFAGAAGGDPQALREVQDLLGDSPRRRDLLIEYLHRIQDQFGCLSPPTWRRWPRS
jgi:hypothetical protein